MIATIALLEILWVPQTTFIFNILVCFFCNIILIIQQLTGAMFLRIKVNNTFSQMKKGIYFWQYAYFIYMNYKWFKIICCVSNSSNLARKIFKWFQMQIYINAIKVSNLRFVFSWTKISLYQNLLVNFNCKLQKNISFSYVRHW